MATGSKNSQRKPAARKRKPRPKPCPRARISRDLSRLRVPIKSLRLDPRNARGHSDRNIDAVAASLDRFGQQTPIKYRDGGVVVKGNATLLAAQRLGWSQIAASEYDGSDGTGAQYALADNRTAELAHWDLTTLAEHFGDMDPETIAALGWTDDEIAAVIGFADVEPQLSPGSVAESGSDVRQRTFLLHESQVDGVERAIAAAQARADHDASPNPNKPGNALALICEEWLAREEQA